MIDGLGEESVVVGATHVIAAVGADQLAMVAGEAMAAGRANLAVVVDRRGLGTRGQDMRRLGGRFDLRNIAERIGASEADRTTL